MVHFSFFQCRFTAMQPVILLRQSELKSRPMRILLINPPDELEAMFGAGKAFVQKYKPLGLLYIAAVARDNGHEVSIIDAHARNLKLSEIKKMIEKTRPEVIGISTLTCNGAMVYQLGKWIKKQFPGILVVLGNIHASVFAKQYLAEGCCDVVVHGEGEHVLCEILKHRENNLPLSDILDISFIGKKGAIKKTGPGRVVEDITTLPLPARDLVDEHNYHLTNLSNQSFLPEEGRSSKTMVSSRGCVFRCKFCAVHRGKKPRYNEPGNVVDELELLQNKHGASYVYLMDPLFNGRPDRVIAICDEIQKRGLTIKWGTDVNANFITPEMVRAMNSANCFELSVGIESGVQRLLDTVNKKLTPEKVRRKIRVIRENSDIRIEGLFILGLPGETVQDSLETIRFACSLKLDMAQFSILCPYPGSPIFNELVAAGELNNGIREDGTVDIAVWKRYSSYICFTKIKPIWVPDTLSERQLRGLQKKALRDFYLRPTQILKQIKRLNKDNLIQAVKVAYRGFF